VVADAPPKESKKKAQVTPPPQQNFYFLIGIESLSYSVAREAHDAFREEE
jgi:hypothetical protein